MELWQWQGFASFGDWRRASERARKAAKKKASAAAPAVITHLPMVRLAWQPLQPLDPPSPSRVAALKPAFCTSHEGATYLGGACTIDHEHVAVTPRGSRVHTIKHTSPGGTTRSDKYVSPASGRQAVDNRNSWRLRLTTLRREERAARAENAVCEQRRIRELHDRAWGSHDPWRIKRWRTCGTCATDFVGNRLFCSDVCATAVSNESNAANVSWRRARPLGGLSYTCAMHAFECKQNAHTGAIRCCK